MKLPSFPTKGQLVLGGGNSTICLSSSLPGEMMQFDKHIFQMGLKPPTRHAFGTGCSELKNNLFGVHIVDNAPPGMYKRTQQNGDNKLYLLAGAGFLRSTILALLGRSISFIKPLEQIPNCTASVFFFPR